MANMISRLIKTIFGRVFPGPSSALRILLVCLACCAASATQAIAAATLPTSLQRAILTGVLQGTESVRLPTSPQSVAYRFDSDLDTYVRSSRPGPTVFRAPSTLQDGAWSARVATSYFQLDGQFWPTTYHLTKGGGEKPFVTALGSLFTANITLVEIAASYGLTDHLELTLDVPISIVNLDAHFRWLYDNGDPNYTPQGDETLAGLDHRVQNGSLREATRPPNESSVLGKQRFDNGTQAGLGQVALGAKYALVRADRFLLSPSFELLLPSPNENEFAGPDDVGVTARILSSVDLADWATGFVDAGYTYQIQFQELTGFVWDAGVSVSPFDRVSLDAGAGGTVFSKGITPNPPVTGNDSGTVEYVANSATELGTNAVNVLFGFKVVVTDAIAASGGVVVPVTNDGIRPAAAGTIALEAYF